jgi:2,3,4,5-tetrahydropyridine-2-carboxylate N-succinyltransferase
MSSFEKARDVLSVFLNRNLSSIKKSDLSEEEIFSIWEILAGLDSGKIRIANKILDHKDEFEPISNNININLQNTYKIDEIAKIAIILSFLLYENKLINYTKKHKKIHINQNFKPENTINSVDEDFISQNIDEYADFFEPSQSFFDKIPSKFENWDEKKFKEAKIRVVPHAYARYASYIAKDVILMPSFVNIGAYIDSKTMIDTWSTVGSCVQIGKNCHISGGVGLGGVLEPISARPTIIEDDCFIGARSEICEGVVVGKGSVISMGCYIGASTRIIDRESGFIYQGYVPEYSVVVPGTYSNPKYSSCYSLYCVYIVKKTNDQTRKKTSINQILRWD